MKLTKSKRTEIVREFCERHGGAFILRVFLEEVQAAGPKHEAFSWFEWDDRHAAQIHRIEQARAFVSDLRISFTIEEISPQRNITVRSTEMPLALSAMDDRPNGGGYRIFDPGNPTHMAEHCRQGASALRAWLKRYEGAARHAGNDLVGLQALLNDLDRVLDTKNDAA